MNFFSMVVIFFTKESLQVVGALDGLGVVNPLDDALIDS